MQQLVIYDAACRALNQARTIDEVKEITNRAEAARAYARQAQNRELEIDALEIRVRAERRLGEIIIALKREGAGLQGRRQGVKHSVWSDRPFVTMKDLGINGSVSAVAQRLASLSGERFDIEMSAWRDRAPQMLRLETPLQRYRVPSIRGDRQIAAHRNGRMQVEGGDRFARFRSPDGRRIADFRVGELDRLEQVTRRLLACINLVQANLPVVLDPLATLEMVFPPAELLDLLERAWSPVDPGYAGVRLRKPAPVTAICECCGAVFTKRNLSGKARAGLVRENRYCTRRCAALARTKEWHGAKQRTTT